ncbi:G-protein alpha subunit [Abortiporus biennis]|nr:G-protein alpha subunit [Abortiporus biennis]
MVSRTVADAEAAKISNAIDEQLRQERIANARRKPREVKVLLLGQAESGKSTLQKQFQLYYASSTLERERPSWRPIVYFNILKAIRMILDELDFHYPQIATSYHPPTAGSSLSSPVPPSTASSAGNVFTYYPPSIAHSSRSVSNPDPTWFSELAYLRHKLLPLVASEDALASELSGGVNVTGGKSGVYVRAGWQALVTPTRAWPLADVKSTTPRPNTVTLIVAKTLAASQYEIYDLWKHSAVRALLHSNKLHLEESAAFLLESIHRVSEPDYSPTNEDILHVRLQTLGVTEHAFDISMGGVQWHWIMYDVGGARPAWAQFFDDARAIIFLAPISAFDQYLEEDPRTNRIDDSLQLFTSICSNKLLQKAALVLMLNKTDLLRQKLQAGIKVRKYISSYGDRPNSYEEVSEYFRAHFIQVQKRKDSAHRSLYVHFTSMLDIRATQHIIVNVGEAIMRLHMADVGLA